MKDQTIAQYALGLDLGSQSIGWTLLDIEDSESPRLIKLGARVFDAGVEGDIESGQDASRNVERRERRTARRMLQRHTRRLVKLAHALQRVGLLPKGDVNSAKARDRFFAALDKTVSKHHTANLPKGDPVRKAAAQLPYFLRARALSEKLHPHELGRALYHLAQRRGFLSNRRETFAEEQDEKETKKKLGPVKEGIAELDKKMAEAHAQTLGQYFASLDPEKDRIRKRWTARRMYETEFKAIWAAQSAHHPAILTDALKAEIHDAIFFQRPLKSQKHLIGACSLEPKAKRARAALLIAQRFRMLQRVNDLELTDKTTGEIRQLSEQERQLLIDAMETKGDLKFSDIRKLPGFKHYFFNLEEGGEKKLPGNRTAAKLIKLFGLERWNAFSPAERDRVVEDILSLENNQDDNKALARRGENAWGLDHEAAQHFANLALEPDYCNLSTKAMKKLLPLLESGVQYATARKEAYGEVVIRTKPADSLEPVHAVLPALRNPTVNRVLTELRTLINSIVRDYGKPAIVRIELARDLKKTRKDRQEIWKKNRENQTRRDEAQEKIKTETPLQSVKGPDIEKELLAEECGWVCPYTGKSINFANLISDAPQFDVEHIIPLSKSFDNSFFNKTLCYHEENRQRKKGNAPFAAYSGDKETYEAILQRVRKFTGSAAAEKLRRFQLEDLSDFDDFTERQLTDTRYASRLAADYVALLYGGRTDENGKLRVQVSKGGVTKFLRDEWNLNSILSDGGQKSRSDHRHHAIDALVIALTEPRTIKMLSDAARRAEELRRRRFAAIAPPWPAFLDDARSAVAQIVVSHRPNRKVSGPLHEETVYSPPCDENGRPDPKGQYHHVRKPLESLTENERHLIADPRVKQAVLSKLTELGGDAKKFQKPENLPRLTAGNGRTVPIKKVRLLKKISTQPVGSGERQRHVIPGSNHHVEIFETKDKKGNVKWDGQVVTMLEAYRRKQAKEPIVKRTHKLNPEFLFSLCGGDVIEIDEEGTRGLYVVRSVWETTSVPRFNLVYINDARKKDDIKKAHQLKSPMLSRLQEWNCQKVIITPLGEVRRAND